MIWFLLLLITPLIASETSKERDYHYLDELAFEAGSDMSSHMYNYTEIYSEVLHDFREKKIVIVEIGPSSQNVVAVFEMFCLMRKSTCWI